MYCIIGTVYCIMVTDVLHYSNWYIAVYQLVNCIIVTAECIYVAKIIHQSSIIKWHINLHMSYCSSNFSQLSQWSID